MSLAIDQSKKSGAWKKAANWTVKNIGLYDLGVAAAFGVAAYLNKGSFTVASITGGLAFAELISAAVIAPLNLHGIAERFVFSAAFGLATPMLINSMCMNDNLELSKKLTSVTDSCPAAGSVFRVPLAHGGGADIRITAAIYKKTTIQTSDSDMLGEPASSFETSTSADLNVAVVANMPERKFWTGQYSVSANHYPYGQNLTMHIENCRPGSVTIRHAAAPIAAPRG